MQDYIGYTIVGVEHRPDSAPVLLLKQAGKPDLRLTVAVPTTEK